MNCFACGVQIPDDVRFCPFCGKDQRERPQENLCHQCGQVVRPDAKFCAHCGAAQQKAPVPEAPAAAVQEEPVSIEWQEPLPVEEPPACCEEAADQPIPVEIPQEPADAPVEEPVTEPEPDPVIEPEPEPAEPVPVPPVDPPPAVHYAPAASAPPVPPAPPITPPPVQPPVYQYNPVPVYQPQTTVQNIFQVPVARPAFQLPTGRGMWKMILLGIVTLGIYPLVIWSKISMEINVAASRNDGQWTMHYLWMCFLAPLTLCIYPLVWIHNLCNRTGQELQRRDVDYRFSASTFWLWNLLYPLVGAAVTAALFLLLPKAGLGMEIIYLSAAAAALVSLIGPFVYLHKHMKAMNLLNADYNQNG